MASAFFTRDTGRSSPTRVQSQASIMAARWPPAECPTTVMRSGSPPCAPMWRTTQARACTICSVIWGMVTAGHSA